MTDFGFQPKASGLQPEQAPLKVRNQWWDVWDQFRSHKGAMAGLFFLTFITLFCAFGPMVWDVDPGKLDIRNKDVRPIYVAIWDGDAKTSWARPMGTDHLGRDIMANIMQGGRISLAVGWTAMILAIFIGTFVGVMSGYFKRLDWALMRFTDLVLSLPIPVDRGRHRDHVMDADRTDRAWRCHGTEGT